MVRCYSYALSGKEIVSGESRFYIRLLINAGAVFPFRPKYNNVKGKLLFYTIQEITEEIKERALALFKEEGVKDAAIKANGSYLKMTKAKG